VSNIGFEERQGFAEVYEELDDEPLNCEELKLNGHTVNGLYSVQGTGKKAMETAYCNFDLTSDTSGRNIAHDYRFTHFQYINNSSLFLLFHL